MTDPEDDRDEFLHSVRATASFLRQAKYVLQKAIYDIEDLGNKLEGEWMDPDGESYALADESRNFIATLAAELSRLEAGCAAKELGIERDLAGLGYEVRELLKAWRPPEGSHSAMLLDLLRAGTNLVHRPEENTVAAPFEVRGGVFILRVLGWQIERHATAMDGVSRTYFTLPDHLAPARCMAGGSWFIEVCEGSQ
jgi:hypothetical protein